MDVVGRHECDLFRTARDQRVMFWFGIVSLVDTKKAFHYNTNERTRKFVCTAFHNIMSTEHRSATAMWISLERIYYAACNVHIVTTSLAICVLSTILLLRGLQNAQSIKSNNSYTFECGFQFRSVNRADYWAWYT